MAIWRKWCCSFRCHILVLMVTLQLIFFLRFQRHVGNDSTDLSLLQLSGSNKESRRTGPWTPTRHWIQECVARQERADAGLEPFQIAWRGYTLGDCVLMCYKCRISIRSSPLRKESLAGQYLLRACPKGGIPFVNNQTRVDWESLEEILSERHFDRPPDQAVVLHLRLGDVIEQANASVVEMLWEGGNPAHNAKYSNSIKSISEYLENIRDAASLIRKNQSQVQKIPVILRGGAHFHVYYTPRDQGVVAPKSRTYANCLREALAQAGRQERWNVSMIVDGLTPDQDFYYCSHAKYFIVSVGGYSQLMGEMVSRQGGQVIGRTFI